MTLFRHLTWLVLFFSFLIQLGSASLFIWHSQSSITRINENQAAHTAEVLANTLALPEFSPSNDSKLTDHNLKPLKQALRAITDPLISSGQYRSITILKNKEVLYAQELPLVFNGVPDWFELRFGQRKPAAQITRFLDKEELEVVVEMNHAKSTYSLYKTIISAIQWVLLGMIATGIALYFSLKKLLRPLAQLEIHAKAISNHQFDHQLPIPQTRELQEVAIAMNQMSRKLNTLFLEQLEIIQQSRRLAFEDSLTQLPNAVAFENYVKSMSADIESKKTGFIVLCRLAGLESENNRSSRLQADNYIKRFAHLWQKVWQELHPGTYCARRNSSEFLACIETDNYSNIQRSIQAIDNRYSLQKDQGDFSKVLHIHMSMHYFDSAQGHTAWTAICSTLEQNIAFAMDTHRLGIGPNFQGNSHNQESSLQMTNEQWNNLLTQTIAEKNIILEFQPIQFLNDEQTSMAECFMRIPYNDTLLFGAEVWPMINQLQLTYAFDRLIVQMSLAHLNENPTQNLSLNICDATLEDPQFPDWLNNTLKHYPDLIDCLQIEVRESFLNSPNALHTLIELRSIGIKIVLDRVIAQQVTIDQLVRLPINGLKMNIHFLRRSYSLGAALADALEKEKNTPLCHSSTDHHQHVFLTNLMSLCRTCDVDIIADGVESEEDEALAEQLKVNAIQGFRVSPPLQSCGACIEWSTLAL